MTLSERLKAIIDNPDDLTELPGIVESLIELETENETMATQIGQLHELNRKYLKMIPIKDGTEPKEVEPDPVTPEQAAKEILAEIH